MVAGSFNSTGRGINPLTRPGGSYARTRPWLTWNSKMMVQQMPPSAELQILVGTLSLNVSLRVITGG